MDSRDYNYYYYNLNCFNQPQASPNQNQAFHHHWQGSFIPPIAATERSPSPSTSSEGNETACSSTRKSYDRWSKDNVTVKIDTFLEVRPQKKFPQKFDLKFFSGKHSGKVCEFPKCDPGLIHIHG